MSIDHFYLHFKKKNLTILRLRKKNRLASIYYVLILLRLLTESAAYVLRTWLKLSYIHVLTA